MKKIQIRFWIYALASVAVMVAIFCFSCQTGENSTNLSKKFFDKMKENGMSALTPKITLIEPEKEEKNETKTETETDDKTEKKDKKKPSMVLQDRKWAHVYLYALLGVFVSLAALELKKTGKIKRLLSAFGASVGVCLLYACSDEFHQHFVEGRTGSVKDVLFDSIGFVTAVIVVFAVWKAANFLHRRKI